MICRYTHRTWCARWPAERVKSMARRKTPQRRTSRTSTAKQDAKQRTRMRQAVRGKRKRAARPAAGLRTLYPAIEPYRTGRLRVSDLHEIYFEECGNPQGKPAIFVHGGPGAGCDAKARRFFDPDAYRI